MAWLSRNDFVPSDKLHADDLNNLANDDRTWGGDVNGGGHVLANVILAPSVLRSAVSVTSVFGRTGDVVAQPTDYTPAFIGAVPTSRQVIAGAGLTGGGPLTTDVTLTANVTSVFGRTGAVTLTPSDLTASNAVLTSRRISTNAGSGLSGGGNLTADLNLAVVPDSVNERVQVFQGGVQVGPATGRPALNFIQGANVTLQVTDDFANNRVNIAVASTGGAGGMVDPTQAVGDLIVRGPSVPNRLPLGTNGQVLTVDTNAATGVKWATASGAGAVASVFGRTGAIVATVGDYAAAQVTNAVDATQSYSNPAWITALAWAKITNAPNFLTNVLTTKGDIPVQATSTTQGRLPVGADGTILIADSAQTLGVRWGAAPGGTPQSPWVDNVNAANFNLSSVKAIGIGAAAAAPFPLLIKAGSSDASPAATAIEYTDQTSLLMVGCSATYGTGGAPWFQGYYVGGGKAPLVLQPDLVANRGVGIGQTHPAYPLDVLGDVNCTGNFRVNGVAISGGGAQSPWLTDIDAASHNLANVAGVGIGGGVAAGAQLSIAGANPAMLMQAAAANGVAGIALQAASVQWMLELGYAGVGNFTIRDAVGGTHVQINATGVGLGHAPNFSLDVSGDVNCTGVYRINGVSIGGVTTVFGRTGAVVPAIGDYNAAQVINAVDTTQTYANPAWITALAWSKITGAPPTGVSSVFGRTGAVVAAAGDYTVGQVTGAVANTRKVSTGLGLSGGGDLTADRTLAVIPDSTNQQIVVMSNAGIIGTRHALNFIGGANVTISVSDNPGQNRVDVGIASSASGGSGGMTDPTLYLGDLIVRGTSAPNRLAVGPDGSVLTADAAEPLGIKWAVPAAAGGQNQSPWLSDVDAAGHSLLSGGTLNAQQVKAATLLQVLTAPDALAIHPTNVAWNTSGGLGRWQIAKITAESGGNAGSDLAFQSFDDAGIALATPLLIARATGRVGVNIAAPAYPLDIAGDLNITGQYRVNGAPLNLGGVTSVFGRTGDVTAQAGDYTAAQVTGAVSTSASYNNPTWITALAWSKITGAPAFLVDPTTTKGDLIVHGSTTTRLPVGPDGQVLTADATQATGVKWAAAAGAVASVFSRTGAVVAQTGDYTAAQVTNAVDTTSGYANPAWITSLAWTKVTGVPVTAKGDLLTYGTSPTRLPVGTNGQLLIADSTQTLGLKWANVAAAQTPWTSDIDAAGHVLYNVGKIGIGTPNPGALLEVVLNGVTGPTINVQNTNATSRNVSLNFMGAGGLTWGISSDYYGNGGTELNFVNTAGSRTVTVLQSGNVGIGTTTPKCNLQVAGPANQPQGLIRLDTVYTAIGDYAALGWSNPGEPEAVSAIVGRASAGAQMAFDFRLQNGANTFASANTVMTVRGDGRVGIGTVNPGGAFHVNASDEQILLTQAGAGAATKGISISFNNLAGDPTQGGLILQRRSTAGAFEANLVTVNVANGYVGIGSAATSPAAPLHVVGPDSLYTAVFQAAANPIIAVIASGLSSNLSMFVANSANAYLNGTQAKDACISTGGAAPGRLCLCNGGYVRANISASGVFTAGNYMTLGFPSLGTTPGGFGVSYAGDWGLFMGGNPDGTSWIQNQRTDSATAYPLSVQPAGGSVCIGPTNPWGKLNVWVTNNQHFIFHTRDAVHAWINVVNDAGSANMGLFLGASTMKQPCPNFAPTDSDIPAGYLTIYHTTGNPTVLRFRFRDSGGTMREFAINV